MSTQDPALDNLKSILQRMDKACVQAQRSPQDVQLVLVSKTVPAERLETVLRHVAAQGIVEQPIFGENKAQELRAKAAYFESKSLQPRWHFIGALQSNKIKDMLPHTVLLHSLDRLSLAQKLHKKLQQQQRKLPVLIQVNAAREDSKSGVLPEHALEFVKQVDALDTLELQGFMTIGAHTPDVTRIRDSFKCLADLRAQARALDLKNTELPHLSMGMSGDFEIAIEEGATLIRVGSAIFGKR